jgi:hypothetical protein
MTELEELEKRVKELESKMGTDSSFGKKKRPPREPSEYNKFMKKYFAANKDPKKSHKDLFADAAKAWNVEKAKK